MIPAERLAYISNVTGKPTDYSAASDSASISNVAK